MGKPASKRAVRESVFEGLDRLFHERARLALLTALAARSEGVLFNDLKETCALTDGNLSRHLQCLKEAGVVEVWKSAHRGRPQTLVRLSSDGRRRFVEYLDLLEEAVRQASAASRAASDDSNKKGTAGDLGRGLAPA
ncbi:MAG: transcriptional regulator [Planctomycetes bacterium]|nr:transcriptional regulator [Planctomycetota bacterium]